VPRRPRACLCCGIKFRPLRKTKMFCSDACRKAYKRHGCQKRSQKLQEGPQTGLTSAVAANTTALMQPMSA